ncbi:MAG: DMT family protein [Planctomycetaceae bacterium]
MLTVILLVFSNIFMTFAWYGHLKFKENPLWIVILVSWGIAFVEYCFQVPANRWGHRQFSAPQLKMIQEVITLVIFAIFSVVYLKETLRWNDVVGFGFILAAVFFVHAFPRPPAAVEVTPVESHAPFDGDADAR